MLIGLLPATAVAVIVLANNLSRGHAVAALALIVVPALPLWWRWHDGAFRLSAGLIGGAITFVSLWAALAGGLLVLPTGLLLLSAALMPERWSVLRGLTSVAALVAVIIVVPFALYGAYTCARPTPQLLVTLRSGFSDAVVAASTQGSTALERHGNSFLIDFKRGDKRRRDEAVRSLRQHPSVLSVRKGQKRCY